MSKAIYDTINGELHKVNKQYITIDGIAREIKKSYQVVRPEVELRRVPEGYTQVEYIESSGTQYIDTGFKPNQDTKVILDADITSAASDFSAIFGSRINYDNTAFSVWVKPDTFHSDYANGYIQNQMTPSALGRYIIDKNKNITTAKGIVITHNYTNFQCVENMLIGTVANNGTPYKNGLIGKIYSCQIYDNDVLIRDYIPVIASDNFAGLWDFVSQSFFGNTGTNVFVAGGAAAKGIARLFYMGQQIGTISVSPTSASIIGANKTTTATITYTGNGIITAITSNTNIATATISGNTVTVTAKGGGNAPITITIAETDEYTSASCVFSITVTIPVVDYYGTITSLNKARRTLAAAANNQYALFGGGMTADSQPSDTSAVVDAYNTSLTHTVPSGLRTGKTHLAATAIGNYVLFGGGAHREIDSNFSVTITESAQVDAYNTSLTRSTAANLNVARSSIGAASIGNYALFGGGSIGDDEPSNIVDTYNTSLTHSTATNLSVAREPHESTASNGKYVLFCGNYQYYAAVSNVDAYNASLTRSTASNLNSARSLLSATSVGDYVLVGGGYGTGGDSNRRHAIVDTYNTSLTHSMASQLSLARCNMQTTSNGNYAIFAGGLAGAEVSTVDIYDKYLTRTLGEPISISRFNGVGVSIGNYALFGGGYNYSTYYTTVDVYKYKG